MMQVSGRRAAAALAMVTAGPCLCLVLLVWQTVDTFPGPVEPMLDGESAATLLLLAGLVMLVGAILAMIPVVIGVLVMAELGARRSWARRVTVWLAAGLAAGGAIGFAIEPDGLETMLVLGATGGLCAAVARSRIRWHPGDQLRVDRTRTPAEAISACPPK